MKLHLVGGFLGSGKTTAIINAIKLLLAANQRVGVITNDQGKYLVDTTFFRASDLPTVEVTGGCFCCQYDDLNKRLGELLKSADPEVVFAESVGSCADIVATVVKPLIQLAGANFSPASFSVFADARLLLRRLQGEELPFNEHVVYIFDQQIEESGLLVVNKIDLLDSPSLWQLNTHLAERYPGKPILLQTSLTPNGVSPWLDQIQSGQVPLPQKSLEMDYESYAAGETSLAWLDQALTLSVPDGSGKRVIEQLVTTLTGQLAARKAGIGHLKFIIQGKHGQIKFSFPTLEEPGWQKQIPNLAGKEIHLLVNARAELPPGELRALLSQALNQPGVIVQFGEGEAFNPGVPKPTHRI